MTPLPDSKPFSVTHTADFYCRYPGEKVIFYTRVEVLEPMPGFTLSVSLPAGVVPGVYQTVTNYDHVLPDFQVSFDQRSSLVWQVEGDSLLPGTCYEYHVELKVAPTHEDLELESRAVVKAHLAGYGEVKAEEMATVVVFAKAHYLKYLPAIYQEYDDFMNRFLMLFESFWKPIEGQIEHFPFYFDPLLTPPDFLPWLASWIGLALNERWPEKKQRRLLQAAADLYRRRGTRQGLIDYLEIYTDQKAEIIEHRADNFRLGAKARLGPGIALGSANRPHTFTVILRLPPIFSPNEAECARLELERRRTIETIIEAEKPVHTGYTLHLEILSPEER